MVAAGQSAPGLPGRRGAHVRRRRAGGFTLVEVLVSLTLLAILLTALNMLVFSMAEVWGKGQQERVFAEHTRAVTRHVDDMLHLAQQTSTASGGGAALQPVKLQLPAGGGEAVLLTFTLPNGDRLIPWNGEPLPDVVCSLAATPENGLVLYWQSRLDLQYGKEPPQALVLSRFGESIGYDYYDELMKSWKTTEDIQKDSSNNPQTPGRIRLRFVRDKQKIETVLTLPIVAAGVPPA